MLKKFCKCGVIITQDKKMCDKCLVKYNARLEVVNKDVYKRYKNNRTDFKEQKFYKTKEWNITKQHIRAIDNGLCLLCLSKNNIKHSDLIHHIAELKDDYSLRTNESNLISLCNRCHYYVHKKYKQSSESNKEMKLKLKQALKDHRGV